MGLVRPVRPPLARLSTAPKLDLIHPLSRGMTDCIIWNQWTPVNLATPTSTVALGSSPTLVTTIEGPAGYATGTNYYSSADHGNMVAGDFTARFRFIPVSLAGTYTTLCDKYAIQHEFGIYLNSSLQLQYIEFGGSFADGIALGSFTLGKLHDLTITRSGTTVTAYQNGVSLGTIAGGTATVASAGAILAFGHDTRGNTDGDFKILAFNFWAGRALSAGQVFQLYRDPYGFVSYSRDNRVGVTAATFLAAWAQQTNLPVLGTGTY